MNRPDTYTVEYIERYLRGELNKEELNQFEAQMQKDETLKDKIETVKNLSTDLYDIEKDRLSNQVKEWMKTEATTMESSEGAKSGNWFKNRGKLIIGTVFLVLLMAIGYWFIQTSSKNIETRSKEYIAQIYKSPTVLRASSDDQWEMAIQLYRNRDFDQMKTQMKPIIERGNSTAEQKFYFALAHLYAQPPQFNEALVNFDLVEAQDARIYREEISWYRALIYIQSQDYEKARLELEKITSSNQFGSKAKKLLEEME